MDKTKKKTINNSRKRNSAFHREKTSFFDKDIKGQDRKKTESIPDNKESLSDLPSAAFLRPELVDQFSAALITNLLKDERIQALIHSKEPSEVEIPPAVVPLQTVFPADYQAMLEENEKLKSELRQYALTRENATNQEQENIDTITQLQNEVDVLRTQVDNLQQQLVKKNRIMNDALREKEEKDRAYEAMANALEGISAAVFSAIHQPLAELETRASIAVGRKNPQKGDIKAAMTSVIALREALSEIEIGGGYSIEIGSLVSEDIWSSLTAVEYDDNIHANGELGKKVIVRSRGYRYTDATGEEKIVKAGVETLESTSDS